MATLESDGKNKFGEYNLNKLQLDATNYYPYRTKEAMKEKSGKSRGKNAENYNTYNIIGLPPGPICNPGIKAIEAALNPNDTDYQFFLTDKSGTKFYYASTYEQHLKNGKEAGLTE